jgi:hypothetical protein
LDIILSLRKSTSIDLVMASLQEAEASIASTDATADALVASSETKKIAEHSKAPREKKEKKPQKPKADKAQKAAPTDTKGITTKKSDDLAGA